MIVEALTDALFSSLVDRGLSAAFEMRSDSHDVFLEADPKLVASCLKEHLRLVENWSSQIKFRDLPQSKSLAEIFVDLECYLGTLAPEKDQSSSVPPRRVSSLLNGAGHVVILGRPGAGKTTSMQRLALTALERHVVGRTPTPIVLRLRELSGSETILERLLQITGLRVRSRTDAAASPALKAEVQKRAIIAYLNGIRALILLDGLDECPRQLRDQIEREINDLMERASDYRVVLTCRRAEYGFSFPAQAFTLLPLTSEQVRIFSSKWLGTQRAHIFAAQLEASPYSGAEVTPILIAHLCAIFDRRGQIPRRPRYIYQKLVRLLVEEWDEQRGVKRTSRYADFEIDRKLEFLRRIAYVLTLNDSRGSFTHTQLEEAYLHSYVRFGLPRDEYSRVAREIESHNGLILQSSFDHYEFAHKSIQEFLTAEYLLRLPSINRAHFLGLADELAIATALSSRAELYVESVANMLLSFPANRTRAQFSSEFLSRLALESPDFPNNPGLGWTLLGMWSTAVEFLGGLASPQTSELLSSLAGSIEGGNPIQSALRDCDYTDEGISAYHARPKSIDELPDAVATYLSSQHRAGVTINKDLFMSMAGTWPIGD